uniref:Uncharacterized protein n=1 Tax=Micrurus lemniscatus lemniscatus TaxID=129467 RepID=A0A2D4HFB4_MICLE
MEIMVSVVVLSQERLVMFTSFKWETTAGKTGRSLEERNEKKSRWQLQSCNRHLDFLTHVPWIPLPTRSSKQTLFYFSRLKKKVISLGLSSTASSYVDTSVFLEALG